MNASLRMDSRLIRVSFDIAKVAHEGSFYGSEPYITHPVDVAILAQDLGYQPEVIAGCLLHDTIEDTDITGDFLLTRGIPQVVVDGVEAVSFGDTTDIISKIAKAKSNPIGHVIKFCDSSRNFAATVDKPGELGASTAFEYALDYAHKLGELAVHLPTVEDIEKHLSLVF